MIISKSVDGRPDWFLAQTMVNGKHYFQFAGTRQGAFMGVAWQLYQEKGWKV